jgi:hypothetical protein
LGIPEHNELNRLIILIKLLLDFRIIDGVGEDDPGETGCCGVVGMVECVILHIKLLNLRHYK